MTWVTKDKATVEVFDVDHEYVRNKLGEVRYVESYLAEGLRLRYCWRDGDAYDEELQEVSSKEWSLWAGEELELVMAVV